MLEVGCDNGSMSASIAEHVAPDGQIVALDLDLSLVDDVRALCLTRDDGFVDPVGADAKKPDA